MATGLPPEVHRQRTTRTWVPGSRPRAQQMSWGAWRRDTCLAWQLIALPIGSTVVLSPARPSIGIWVSARLTLTRRARALRRGSFQPASRWTRAAAIRSASTLAADLPAPESSPLKVPASSGASSSSDDAPSPRSRPVVMGAPSLGSGLSVGRDGHAYLDGLYVRFHC